jgi:hypothetical protein
MWIIIIALLVVGAISVLSTRYFRDQGQDLGTVSGQWLAEHRHSHES